jgi:hypothetical protein
MANVESGPIREQLMHTIVDARNLSIAEQDLIRAAVGNQGVLEIAMRAELRGRAVVAGRKKFFDPNDSSAAEHYISLLASLKAMDIIREGANKNTYELTNSGWQLSRNLGR